MGLNLPARQVVLYDLQTFDGTDFVPLSVNTVWQRAGRAGRRGLDTQGEVVLIAPSWDRELIVTPPVSSRTSHPALLTVERSLSRCSPRYQAALLGHARSSTAT